MDFFTIARICVYQAQKCVAWHHLYPDEVEIHLCRLQMLAQHLNEFSNMPAISQSTEMIHKLNLWIEEVNRLIELMNHRGDQPDSWQEPNRLIIFTTHHCSGNGQPRIDIDMEAV